MGCKMSEVRILSSRPVRKDLLCAGFFMFDKRVQDLNLRKRRFDYKRKAGGRTPVCKKQMSALAASLRSQSSRPDQIEAFLYGKLFLYRTPNCQRNLERIITQAHKFAADIDISLLINVFWELADKIHRSNGGFCLAFLSSRPNRKRPSLCSFLCRFGWQKILKQAPKRNQCP